MNTLLHEIYAPRVTTVHTKHTHACARPTIKRNFLMRNRNENLVSWASRSNRGNQRKYVSVFATFSCFLALYSISFLLIALSSCNSSLRGSFGSLVLVLSSISPVCNSRVAFAVATLPKWMDKSLFFVLCNVMLCYAMCIM